MNVVATAFLAFLAAGGSLQPLQLSDLDGHTLSLFQNPELTSVFIFTRTDCPISNRYAPEVERLAHAFTSPKMKFWLVYLDMNESVDSIRRHRTEFGYTLGTLLDPKHQLVSRAGAEVTPEAAVFVGDRMVYRGRIDDRYVAFGEARPEPTRRDLEEVLAALDEGRTVQPHTTRAIGCYIADLR